MQSAGGRGKIARFAAPVRRRYKPTAVRIRPWSRAAMNPFALHDAVQELQRRFDVSRLVMDGVNYWMAVRLLMLGRFSGEALRRTTEMFALKSHSTILDSGAVAVARSERRLPSARVIGRSALAFPAPSTAWEGAGAIFYELPADYAAVIDGLAVNRIADGFVDAFGEQVRKVCRFSPPIVAAAKRHEPAYVHVAPALLDLHSLEAVRFREAVRELCAVAVEVCPVFAISQAEILRQVRALMAAAPAHEAWIRDSGARLLLFQSFISFEKMAVLLGARRAGVTTVDVQHGYSDAWSIHNNLPPPVAGQRKVYPDVLWLWGEATARALRDEGTLDSNGVRLVVGGDVWGALQQGSAAAQASELGARLGADGYARRVLVGQQIETLSHSSAIRGYLPAALHEAIVTGPFDWLWMLRLHPRSLHLIEPLKAQLAAEGLTNVEVEQSSLSTIEAALTLADVYLTSFSVSAFEANALGRPVVITDAVGQTLFAREIGAGAFTYAETTEALLEAVSSAAPPGVHLDYYGRDLNVARAALAGLLSGGADAG